MLATLYRAVSTATEPLVLLFLQWRRRHGKEDTARFAERLGVPGKPRPPNPLLWIHAASVGEAMSVLALIERLRRERPGIEILITTGTVASARIVGERLPAGTRHQFVPVDLRRFVDRFLDHWRPGLALWVESELWPNLVFRTRSRGIPMVMINGRLSARSFAGWRWLPGLIRPMLAAFALCLVQDDRQAERFRGLGANAVASIGDLKAAAAPLAADPAVLARLRAEIGQRPVWLAASTHDGEEAAAAAAHRLLAVGHPDILTIIVPRHPGRGGAIAAMLAAQGLRIARRSEGEPIDPGVDVYLADTMGELGMFYRLAEIAFVGGSLVPKGGHNPFEAARLGCAILHGPDMSNCAAMAASLAAAGASQTVRDAGELARAVSRLLAAPLERGDRAAAGSRVAGAGLVALDAVMERLAPWLDGLAPALGDKEPMPEAPRRRVAVGGDARA